MQYNSHFYLSVFIAKRLGRTTVSYVSVTSSNKSLRTGARSLKRSKTETSRGNARSHHGRPQTRQFPPRAQPRALQTRLRLTVTDAAVRRKTTSKINLGGLIERKTFSVAYTSEQYLFCSAVDVTIETLLRCKKKKNAAIVIHCKYKP